MNLFEQIGGEPGVRALVDRFYDLMDTVPDARVVREMHPEDLGESRDKLHDFLVGWMGGPPLYVQKRGHPRLRARHLPFAVDRAARDQWLWCMARALAETVEDEGLQSQLLGSFARIADHMRNQPG